MKNKGVNETKENFNTDIVKFLKREEKLIREKADLMLEQHDFSMYTKLINAYENVVALIKKYDWELKYSEYKTEEDQKQIAIWEQNDDGLIRNHKTWTIDKEYKLYFDVNKGLEDKSWVNVYFNGEHYKYQNLTFSQLASILKDLIYREDNVGVYSDCVGMDIGLVDALNDLGIEVNKMKRNSINIK